jgi:hypothetical protein
LHKQLQETTGAEPAKKKPAANTRHIIPEISFEESLAVERAMYERGIRTPDGMHTFTVTPALAGIDACCHEMAEVMVDYFQVKIKGRGIGRGLFGRRTRHIIELSDLDGSKRARQVNYERLGLFATVRRGLEETAATIIGMGSAGNGTGLASAVGFFGSAGLLAYRLYQGEATIAEFGTLGPSATATFGLMVASYVKFKQERMKPMLAALRAFRESRAQGVYSRWAGLYAEYRLRYDPWFFGKLGAFRMSQAQKIFPVLSRLKPHEVDLLLADYSDSLADMESPLSSARSDEAPVVLRGAHEFIVGAGQRPADLKQRILLQTTGTGAGTESTRKSD